MEAGDRYIVKTNEGVAEMEVIVRLSEAIKVRWKGGREEWIWLKDFKAPNIYVDPDYVIIEPLS